MKTYTSRGGLPIADKEKTMARRLKALPEMTEIYTEFDGVISEVRFFRVSKSTYNWLAEHGALASVSLYPDKSDTIISVAATVDSDCGWGGWSWIHDEFLNSGLNPSEWGL